MCLDTTPEIIHDFIGHDGTDIWWPPHNMQGIHIQEIQQYAMSVGKMFAPYESFPMSAPDYETEPKAIFDPETAANLFSNAIIGRTGIIVVEGHAIAFSGLTAYDPKGFIKSVADYEIREAWILTKLI